MRCVPHAPEHAVDRLSRKRRQYSTADLCILEAVYGLTGVFDEREFGPDGGLAVRTAVSLTGPYEEL